MRFFSTPIFLDFLLIGLRNKQTKKEGEFLEKIKGVKSTSNGLKRVHNTNKSIKTKAPYD